MGQWLDISLWACCELSHLPGRHNAGIKSISLIPPLLLACHGLWVFLRDLSLTSWLMLYCRDPVSSACPVFTITGWMACAIHMSLFQ